MTIKEFCEKYRYDDSSIYKKIKRNSEKLNEHIKMNNGIIEIDEIAEDILKPKAKAEVIELNQKLSDAEKTIERAEWERNNMERDFNERLADNFDDYGRVSTELYELTQKYKEALSVIEELKGNIAELEAERDRLNEQLSKQQRTKGIFGRKNNE